VRAVDAVLAALAAHGGAGSSWLVGEPCVEPPAVLREALARAAREGSYRYPPSAGLPRLREVLAERHREGGARVAPEQVVVTAGAKGGLLALLAALLEPGDELIHPRPCYPAYPAMARRLGAQPVAVPETGRGFAAWAGAAADRIGPRTRAVVVASPSNPSGATLAADEARELVALCREQGVRLICDEAYGEFRFASGTEALAADFDPGRGTVVQLRSASKSWALCGWRLGWVVADADLAARVAARHAALLNPASGPAQAALAALPEVPADYLDTARSAVRRRLDAVYGALSERGHSLERPAGGFYLWLGLDRRRPGADGDGTTRFCVDAARTAGVGLWPGEDFGGPGHVRVAVTSPAAADWESALAALVAVLAP
jgi:aspartate/methionine/tyrosine aminotransferase